MILALAAALMPTLAFADIGDSRAVAAQKYRPFANDLSGSFYWDEAFGCEVIQSYNAKGRADAVVYVREGAYLTDSEVEQLLEFNSCAAIWA
jgi:hypothetical protein